MTLILTLLAILVLPRSSFQQSTCGSFEVKDGSVDFSHVSGIYATVQCNTGYNIQGAPTLTCIQHTRKWSPYIPTCEEDLNFCSISQLEKRNRVRTMSTYLAFTSPGGDERLRLGGVVSMRCDSTSEKASGHTTVVCIAPERFNIPPMQCEGYCRTFDVGHGTVDYSDPSGLYAKTKCDAGFKLNGSPILTCIRPTKTWNLQEPRCEEDRSYCVTSGLERQNNVRITAEILSYTFRNGETRIRVGGYVTLKCEDNSVKQSGYETVVCVSPQRYNLDPLKCKGNSSRRPSGEIIWSSRDRPTRRGRRSTRQRRR